MIPIGDYNWGNPRFLFLVRGAWFWVIPNVSQCFFIPSFWDIPWLKHIVAPLWIFVLPMVDVTGFPLGFRWTGSANQLEVETHFAVRVSDGWWKKCSRYLPAKLNMACNKSNAHCCQEKTHLYTVFVGFLPVASYAAMLVDRRAAFFFYLVACIYVVVVSPRWRCNVTNHL